MQYLDIEQSAKEIAKQTVNEVLHSDDKAMEQKVFEYAQLSIQILLKNYTDKINRYEKRINLVHEDMERIYDDLINNHDKIDEFSLIRRGHRFIHALNVCYILEAISFEDVSIRKNTINNLIPKELQNRL